MAAKETTQIGGSARGTDESGGDGLGGNQQEIERLKPKKKGEAGAGL
jgi:hypothetical protein